MLQKNDNMKENQRVKIMEMGEHITIDRRVEVIGLDVIGTIAFVGNTQFAAGQWLGLNLDIPRGNNDGSVKGISYFKCDEKHGMFVRTSQIKLLDEMIMDRDDEEKFVEDLIPNTNNSTWAEDFPIIPPPKEFADDPPESPVSPTFCFCCSIPNDSLEHTVLINNTPTPIQTSIDAASNIESNKISDNESNFNIVVKEDKVLDTQITSDEGIEIAENNEVGTTSGEDDDQRSLDIEDNDQKDSTDQNDDQSCTEENEESDNRYSEVWKEKGNIRDNKEEVNNSSLIRQRDKETKSRSPEPVQKADNNDKSCCSSTKNEDGIKPTSGKIFDRGRIVYAKPYDNEQTEEIMITKEKLV